MSEFVTFRLSNGIRCVYKRTKSAVTHCALTINAGSRDELPREHGIAHFVEHGLFKGTEKRRAHHISSRLENLGGELNAYTTKEETTVNATTLRADFAKAAELISDMVFRSTFPQREIERERQVIIDEINSYRDMPQEMLYDTFDELMFAASPLGRSIAGSARSVSKFDSAALKNFVTRTYTPDQMVFSAIGNISEKSFSAACEHYFGQVPVAVRDFSRVAPPPFVPFEKIVTKGANHQAHCILGARAYDLHDDRRVALSLVVNILGGPGANSRLNTVLRERHGLTYSVEAAFQPFTDSGFTSIYFSCERDKIERCRQLIATELTRIIDTPLTARQLSMAKKQFIGQFAIATDSTESYMMGAAKSFLIYGSIDSTAEVVRKVREISADDVTTAAREVFSDVSTLIFR